jgi:type I restriction enzyme S subunit
MKAYPQYKDSDVVWLGKVPEGWNIKPGLSVFKEKKVKNIGLTEKRVLSLSYGKIIIKPEEKLRGLVPESFETYQIVDPGDIIIRSTDMQNDHTSLRTGLVSDRGIITSAYLCLNSIKSVDLNYIHWLLHGLDLKKVFYGLGSGLRQNLSWKDFKRMPLLIPPEDEQLQIARYLDWQTSKINKFIKAKKKLIELLIEEKQCIINEAVTKGLDPDVKMKDSEVEWLGEIPEHWELKRNKVFFSERKEIVGNRDKEYKLLSLTIRGIIYRDLENFKGKFPSDFSTYQVVYPNDFVFCFFDVDETPRTVGLSSIYGMITGAYTVLKTKNISRSYLYYYYLSMDNKKGFKPIYRGLRKTIPFDSFMNSKLPVPPGYEQLQIVNYLKNEFAILDKTINKAEKEIELIQEYCTRLISDVVTGKIDVRNIEIPNFKFTEAEMEVLDDKNIEDEFIAEDVE